MRDVVGRRGRGNAFGSFLLGSPDQGRRVLRLRVQVMLTVLLVSTNVIGALVVVGLSMLVVPGPPPNSDLLLAAAIAIPVYVGVAVVVGAVWGTAWALRALRWASEGREPDERDRRRALRVPLRLTAIQGGLWATAALLFTTLTVILQPDLWIAVALTNGISGVVVCSIAYLFSEFALRPIAARALMGHGPPLDRGSGVRRRMMLFWSLGTGVPTAGLFTVAILSFTRDDISLERLRVIILVIAGVVLTFGALITLLNARAVVAPILAVRDALALVERGDLDVEVVVYDGTELGRLQAGFNEMVTGMKERERIRDLFGRHVGQEVADAAVRREVELGGEIRTVSVLFIDIVGSTGFAVDNEPTEVVEVLNRFFAVVVDEIDRARGLVNKFMGDAVLAVFGAPVEHEDHAGAALAAARRMAERLLEEVPEIRAGIGVSTGEAVAGNVGDAKRFEYTVIGDAVNTAARLTELAKDVEGCILVTRTSVETAGGDEAAHWVHHEDVTLRGRSTTTATSVLAPQARATRSA
ncbi:adenylate/guanylate cyclase domain-containing protein [Nocardioides sp. CFH 31398]|uniref:adenylate/guanylate cyclase domain-containing protein n=1 Tax=Nocardioides sp. CFH 31398 TaxID=2919579 RepID=UPI001F06A066|nr:adenylate/guanylate cyclase domain-containing protein [Nocardioides sp. CFH 31398]MCH1866767.1 HAMP domain-containing protein [Nocardioides sp. CFH 31398]